MRVVEAATDQVVVLAIAVLVTLPASKGGEHLGYGHRAAAASGEVHKRAGHARPVRDCRRSDRRSRSPRASAADVICRRRRTPEDVDRQLLARGLLTSLPNPAEDVDDEPISVEGEAVSETIIRVPLRWPLITSTPAPLSNGTSERLAPRGFAVMLISADEALNAATGAEGMLVDDPSLHPSRTTHLLPGISRRSVHLVMGSKYRTVSRFPDTRNPACRRHAPSSAPWAVNGRPLPASPHPARGWFASPPSAVGVWNP